MVIRRNPYSNNDEVNDKMFVSKSFEDNKRAADLIRQKVAQIYSQEPDAKEEIAETTATVKRSKHQQYMYNLSSSGKDLATIQTEWHNYYTNLSNEEKYEVWQEFYDSQSNATKAPSSPKPEAKKEEELKPTDSGIFVGNQDQDWSAHKKHHVQKRHKPKPTPTPKAVQSAVKDKVTAKGKLKAKHQVQSLLFGLGMGFIVIFIFLFGFFNEIIIAPFIQPSRASADTPIIINTNVAPTATPEVIIPKINVEIPVDYSETSTNENNIENDLEDGVVHYPTTVLPGQTGNAAYFGHSSNNIFNQGKYKFAFVLLHTLVKGDTFYLTYNDKVYVYKVISTAVVPPSDVSVLNPVPGQTATATLITCDPPGTSINRLVVVGQQISPSPTTNIAPATTQSTGSSSSNLSQLPGNGPTVWAKFYNTSIGKIVVFLVIVGAIFLIMRKTGLKLKPA
jgi:LPXTG-site transpeptidase (sortase) family protein